MTVLDVEKDLDAMTLTITSEFAAPVDRVWQVWADPRQLERWWGPPTHPATVVDHDLSPESRVTYFMTGPEGEKYHGWRRIISVEPPHFLGFEDGFADESGQPDDGLPVTITEVRLTSRSPHETTMAITAKFASVEAMEQILAMGVEEGMTLALGQIDAIVSSGDPS